MLSTVALSYSHQHYELKKQNMLSTLVLLMGLQGC